MLWLIKLLKSSGFIKNLANPQKTCKDLNADSFDPYETLLLPLCPSQNNVYHTLKPVSGFFAQMLKMPVFFAPVCQDSAGLLTKLGKCMIYLIKIVCKFKQVGERDLLNAFYNLIYLVTSFRLVQRLISRKRNKVIIDQKLARDTRILSS